jgi:hypothetical protein
MRNLWSDRGARAAVKNYRAQGVNEDLALRTYTTRLLGVIRAWSSMAAAIRRSKPTCAIPAVKRQKSCV